MIHNPTRTVILVLAVFGLALPVVAGEIEEAYDPGGLPTPLKSLIAEEHIVVYATNGSTAWDARTADDTRTYSLKTDESGRITSFNRTVSGDKTFEILLEQSVLTQAAEADNAQASLVDAYQAGLIEYRGVGFWDAALTKATKATTSTATGMYNGVTAVASWVT